MGEGHVTRPLGVTEIVVCSMLTAPSANVAPNLSALWLVVSIVLHAIVVAGVGYLLLRIRSRDKTLDDRLDRHEERFRQAGTALSEATQA